MAILAVSVQIDAPPQLVWRRLSEVTAWPAWLPTVRKVEPQGATGMSLGSKFRVVQPKLRPMVWQVVELQAGRQFAWAAASPGLSLWANHIVDACGEGARLSLEFRFGGILGALASWLLGGITRRYLAIEAAALKSHAEADASRNSYSSRAPAS